MSGETAKTLPAGTVTFLFTDIEGSTRLWEASRDAMSAALARHDHIMRTCIGENCGHLVKHTGDGLMAVFATAPEALRAALAAQQCLEGESWPVEAQIRARMSLHTGIAETRDGDYFGPTLNRAARLMSLSHGGQTLLSRATHDLCCDLLPPGVELRPLGEHNLKDIARAEVVYQAWYPALKRHFPPLGSATPPIDDATPSIAVLPFADMSKDGDSEYFADGLAEELLNVLAKITGLRVASRTSAFSFKGSGLDIPTMARKLNVANVLEGSVRTSGNRVRVTAQLIRVATDSHLWSNTYDRDLGDLFAVQDDIAKTVAAEIRGALPLGKGVSAALGHSRNLEAYRLYLQARHHIARFTGEDAEKALECARAAVERDPEFALGWAGLSHIYTTRANDGSMPLHATFESARSAARKALALEAALPEGHAALGRVQFFFDWDWMRAEASFGRALELAPSNAGVAKNAAILSLALGRLDEALMLYRRAALLDPLSVGSHGGLGLCCLNAGRLDEAEAAIRRAHELNTARRITFGYLGMVHMARGHPRAALVEFEREPIDSLRLLGLAMACHDLGQRERSDAALDELVALHAQAGSRPYSVDESYLIAAIHAHRENADAAFEWLDRAFTERSPGMITARSELLFRKIHEDPRWGELLRKLRVD